MNITDIAPWASITSPAIAAIALFFAWRAQRENQLRRSEVLAWANDAIRVMQLLTLQMRGTGGDNAKILELGCDASVLVEKGRMFFKNRSDEHGASKPPAYRGLRPVILDQLVIAAGAAWNWESASAEKRARLAYIVAEAEQWFVSLAQMEVGRSRIASEDAGRPGESIRISNLISNISDEKLASWKASTVDK